MSESIVLIGEGDLLVDHPIAFDQSNPEASIASVIKHPVHLHWAGQSPLVHLQSGIYQLSGWRHPQGMVICEGLSDQVAIDASRYILGLNKGPFWDRPDSEEARRSLSHLLEMVILWRESEVLCSGSYHVDPEGR